MNSGLAWPDDAVAKCNVYCHNSVRRCFCLSACRELAKHFHLFSPSGFPAQKVNMLNPVTFAVVATTAIIAITRLQPAPQLLFKSTVMCSA